MRFVQLLQDVRRFLWRMRTFNLAVIVLGGAIYFGTGWLTLHLVADRLQTADDNEVSEVLDQLDRFGARGYTILVDATNSPRSAMALAARRHVEQLVERWQREAYLYPASFDLNAGPLALAMALGDQTSRMSPSCSRWSHQVMEQLLELAQEQPLNAKMELIGVCETAIGQLPQDDVAAVLADQSAGRFDLMLDAPSRRSQLATNDETPVPVASNNPAVVVSPPRESIPEVWNQPQPTPVAPRQTIAGDQPSVGQPEELPRRNTTPATEASTILPAPLPDQVTIDAKPVESTREQQTLTAFAKLAGDDEMQQNEAEGQLYELGFGKVTPREARMMLSTSVDDRLALVDHVLSTARLESRPWLERLLEDKAGEVRAGCIAAIATSGDRQLLERALNIAIRDGDPRVADQVPLLQERLR